MNNCIVNNKSDTPACYIFGAGDLYYDCISISNGDFVIAADGGYLHTVALGIKPDLVLGDFDSLDELPENENIQKYKCEKNETDMVLAVSEGLKRGYTVFHICGGTGGRFEHTLANLQTLVCLSRRGDVGYLYDDGRILTAVTDGEIHFDVACSGYVSAFAYGGEAKGVNEKGLKYSLNNATLTDDFPLGVSNEFTGNDAYISVEQGTLIVVYDNRQLL